MASRLKKVKSSRRKNLTASDKWPYGFVPPTHKGYVEDENGCWIYQGFVDRDGYGLKAVHGERQTSQPATRFFWTKWVGPIDPLLELDHKCRVRACVNPEHLREVTRRQNVRYALPYRTRKQGCPRGHSYTEPNTYYSGKYNTLRSCKTCVNARSYARRYRISMLKAVLIMERRYGTRPLRRAGSRGLTLAA